MSKPLILLAIDGREERLAIASQLAKANTVCRHVDHPEQLIPHLDRTRAAALIVDVDFGGEPVLQRLRSASARLNGRPVVFRAHRSATELELALEASQSGVGQVLLAPHDQDQLRQVVERARAYLKRQQIHIAAPSLSAGAAQNGRSGTTDLESILIGNSPPIARLRTVIREIANTRASVLLQGESGTGKQLTARAIHRAGRWADGPFCVASPASMPRGSMASHLFGRPTNSTTTEPPGERAMMACAAGGTLYIDELAELELPAQLPLLQRLERLPLGKEREADNLRVIAATSYDPRQLVKQAILREDLYFHLDVVPIRLPPLRDRFEDLPLLAEHFLRQAARTHDRPAERFSDQTLQIMATHSWPGNVRQLASVVERMVLFAGQAVLEPCHLPPDLGLSGDVRHDTAEDPPIGGPNAPLPAELRRLTPLQRQERMLIIEALRKTGDNVVEAADLLRMGQATVYRKIRQYRIAHVRRRRKRA